MELHGSRYLDVFTGETFGTCSDLKHQFRSAPAHVWMSNQMLGRHSVLCAGSLCKRSAFVPRRHAETNPRVWLCHAVATVFDSRFNHSETKYDATSTFHDMRAGMNSSAQRFSLLDPIPRVPKQKGIGHTTTLNPHACTHQPMRHNIGLTD